MVFLCNISVFLGKNGRFRNSDGLKSFGKIPINSGNGQKFENFFKKLEKLKNYGKVWDFWARLPDLEKHVWTKFFQCGEFVR